MSTRRPVFVTLTILAIIAAIGVAAALNGFGFGREAVAAPAEPPPDVSPVRNVIVMISDGCGFNHVEAATLFEYGEPRSPLYDSFPVSMASSTYAAGGSYDPEKAATDFDYVMSGATDSAAAATALATGVKTYAGAIGVGPDRQPVKNVVEHAESLGKATGVVTSVPLSHATPAGFVAHNESRGNYVEIANEMIHDSAVDVIMGGGHPDYDADGRPVEGERQYRFVGGEETWQALRNGSAGGDADGDGQPDPWTLIDTTEGFLALQSDPTPGRVFGVAPVAETLQQERSGDSKADAYTVPLTPNMPTLAEMTRGALNVLDNDPDGLFLMVEGGAVDWASHGNQCGRVIEEQIDFNRAVEAVIDWTETNSNWDETLLIVTADHECGYLTGPNADPEYTRPVGRGLGIQPLMEFHSTGHTNSLVPFFARGAAAAAFIQMAEGTDLIRGPWVDNTAVAAVIFSALR